MRFQNILTGIFFPMLCLVTASGQNISDLAVMNDKSADGREYQSDSSTVDTSVFRHPDRIRFDHRCFQIDGEDVFLLSGTFHYFRTPQPLWRDRLLKLKEAGFNGVETYVPWNWHERQMPESVDDLSKLDMKPLEQFLKLAEQMGLYVIIRPGPYICAEWSGGGFPQWLMRKRPEKTRREVWLQSDDEAFMQWNEHWYRAVCKTVAPHQIQKRKRHAGGVILFQIENEFNRVKWFPRQAKKAYLEKLASISRNHGIEVPLITCWTSEARNAESGPLNGGIDMVNSYPRWQIEKNFGRLINQQLKTQPGKPLLSGELQGGWYSDVGGKRSEELDGVAAVQTQNILLYALQRGFCGVNFYMAVGGTNFDDWASRDITATYDCAAAIGEDGTTGERYRRIRALAPFLLKHGARIARAKEIYPAYTCSDSTVSLCLRQTSNGDRYYFVRTEEHSRWHRGTLRTADVTIDYNLEPFGSQVYYVRRGAQRGEWFPRQVEFAPQERHPNVVHATLEARFVGQQPRQWSLLKPLETIDQQGHYGRHPIYYRALAPAGSRLTVGRTGKGVVNGTGADDVLVSVDGQQLHPVSADDHEVHFQIPGELTSQEKEVLMLYVSRGLHHHTNAAVEQHWQIGPAYVRCDGRPLPLGYALTEAADGLRYSVGKERPAADGDGLLRWNIYTFDTPVTQPCHFHMERLADGFLYLNGHPIGRSWSEGPQRDFYLPECWLNKKGKNILAISETLNKR